MEPAPAVQLVTGDSSHNNDPASSAPRCTGQYDRFLKDVALYLAATKGNLNEIVRIFDLGGRINGYLDNNDLDALAIAKEKGFILVCDWLSEDELEERSRIFREWLESDERKQLDFEESQRGKQYGSVSDSAVM